LSGSCIVVSFTVLSLSCGSLANESMKLFSFSFLVLGSI
jgi:hypothetical protein